MNNLLPYKKAIIEALPQIFSMIDRELCSKTYGCADRVYWSWKFIDFPGARFQEIANVLANLIIKQHWLDERVIQQDVLIGWTKATIKFWTSLQHKDGSFDEAYPYERSLAATAFTGFYVGQAFLKIKNFYTDDEQKNLIHTFKKAGDWLCLNDERHGVLSNHLAAAACALDTLAEITSEKRFIQRRDYFIKRIYTFQSEEGWYEEYGGADPGYQTHTIFYLSFIWSRTKNAILLDSLEKSIQYFWHFVHIDGSIGGEYGSRNTRFFMPAGFEILANIIPEAAAVARFMRNALRDQCVIGLHAMDAYNIFPLMNNYFFAFEFATHQHHPTPTLPFDTIGIKQYEKSGHIILSTSDYQAIIGTSKGGTVSAFSKNKTQNIAHYFNSGIVLELINGKKISSQGLHCSKIKTLHKSYVEIEAQFAGINQMLMSPEKFIVFRLISLISAPLPSLAYYLKNVLVKVLVKRKKQHPIRLLRKIMWSKKGLIVKDHIILDKLKSIKTIQISGRFSAIHMGSSRYFEWQELNNSAPLILSAKKVRSLNKKGTLIVEQNWSVE